MTPRERRLRRLEYQRLYAMAEEMGAAVGISAAEMLAEIRNYLRKSPAEREVFMADFFASLTPQERLEVDALEARYARILGSGPTTPPQGRRTR